MSNSSSILRQIVQDGLNIRAEERRNAALEAQAYQLRLIIHENHVAKTTPKQPEPARVAQKAPDKETKARLTEKRAERAERDKEADLCYSWCELMIRVFAPVLIAAIALSLSIPLWLTIPVTFAGCALSIATFAVWLIRNRNTLISNLKIFE